MDDYAGGWEIAAHLIPVKIDATLIEDRPNIYARVQTPWVLVMCCFLAVGFFLLFQDDTALKMSAFGVLAVCMFMLIVWVTRIKPRAAKIPEKKKSKRKNKHSVYRRLRNDRQEDSR